MLCKPCRILAMSFDWMLLCLGSSHICVTLGSSVAQTDARGKVILLMRKFRGMEEGRAWLLLLPHTPPANGLGYRSRDKGLSELKAISRDDTLVHDR